MFLRRLFLSCTLLSGGLLLPVCVSSAALSQMPSEIIDDSASEAASPDMAAPAVDVPPVAPQPVAPQPVAPQPVAPQPVASQIEIEERFEAVPNEDLFNYRFAGNENEIIVIYKEIRYPNRTIELYTAPTEAYRSSEVDLFLNADGELMPVQRHLYYPSNIDLNESDGVHVAYRLPQTGEYYLRVGEVFTDSSPNLLRIRSASYYERLMMAGDEKQVMSRYDEAARLYGLAIAQRPDQPTPYSSRITTYVSWVLDNSAVQETLDDIDDSSEIIEMMHTGFLTLASTDQALVIEDFRQIAQVYKNAIAAGKIDAENFSPEDFIAIADFLETGESNEAVEQILFGIDR